MSNQVTVADIIDKLVVIYREIELLTSDAKAILAEAKESGMNAPMLSKVAKAKASDKFEELVEKTTELSELLDEVA